MTPEDELTIEQLKQLVREKDERIAELENEVAVLKQKRWVVDGCGDDAWDL